MTKHHVRLLLAAGICAAIVQFPEAAFAHVEGEAISGFFSGLSHPVSGWDHILAMIAVGLAGLMLCSMFYRAVLVPRPVAVWGLIGYATILGGSVLQVVGFDLRLIHTIPGCLWELFIGVWLIVKGFRAPPVGAQRTPSATTPTLASSTVGSTTT